MTWIKPIVTALCAATCGGVHGDELTASAIYDRFVQNQSEPTIRYYTVTLSVYGEKAPRELRLWSRTEYIHRDGVRSRAVVRFLEPASARGETHWIIENDDETAEHSLYSPAMRKVRQIDPCSPLRETGLTVCDFLPWPTRAETTRLPDDELDGVSVYVLDVVVPASLARRYVRRTVSLEQLRFAPLRIQFWDEDGAEVRRWTAEPGSIRRRAGQSYATASVLRDMETGSETALTVESREAPRLDLPGSQEWPWGTTPLGDFWIERDDKPGSSEIRW